MNWARDEQDVGTVETLGWRVEGGEQSQIDHVFSFATPSLHDRRDRFLWFDGARMTAMDLDIQFQAPQLDTFSGLGRFGAPMTWAEQGFKVLPVHVGTWITAEATGTVTTWDNHFCEP